MVMVIGMVMVGHEYVWIVFVCRGMLEVRAMGMVMVAGMHMVRAMALVVVRDTRLALIAVNAWSLIQSCRRARLNVL